MVSVTIVTWNSAKYLEECFAALSRQDYREIEVIVVDNASEDGTREHVGAGGFEWRVIYNERECRLRRRAESSDSRVPR